MFEWRLARLGGRPHEDTFDNRGTVDNVSNHDVDIFWFRGFLDEQGREGSISDHLKLIRYSVTGDGKSAASKKTISTQAYI